MPRGCPERVPIVCVLVLLGSCFDGEFLVGLPCASNHDCGPTIECIEGVCGGPGSRCGDGVQQEGEACDDGNKLEGDGCSATCMLDCGNGQTTSGEECDDGNQNDEDFCLSNCVLASCGDGHTLEYYEDCDDGNTNDNDNCTSCKNPTCYDGIRNQDEPDVDCGGTHCAARCSAGATCVTDDDCGSGLCTDSVCAERASLDVGDEHSCVAYDGLMHCWGLGSSGQLGLASTEDIGNDELPVTRAPIVVGAPVDSVAAGQEHTCAILRTGDARCWGRGDRGQLGLGTLDNTGDDEHPLAKRPLSIGADNARASAMELGSGYTCAHTEDDALYCWGLSDILPYDETDAAQVEPIDTNIVAVSTHWIEMCVIEAGDNGNDSPYCLPGPYAINLGDSLIVVSITVGGGHACALTANGDVHCWGRNDSGQLGYATNTEWIMPEDAGIVDVGGNVVQISAGVAHTCARLDDASVRCWGDATDGRLGYGNTNSIGDDETPASAGPVDVGGNVLHISAGGKHTCALLSGGRVRCWGDNRYGQLGYGHTQSIGDDEVPAQAGDVMYR